MTTTRAPRSAIELRDGCSSWRHDTVGAYRRSGCRCPKARSAEMARKAKYEVNRARLHSFLAHIRVGSYAQPGVPPFFTDPARGCATVDPDVMFPEAVEEVPDAQRVCRHCPFKTACHEWAVDTAQAYGVWGGITEQERRREIFARREQAAA